MCNFQSIIHTLNYKDSFCNYGNNFLFCFRIGVCPLFPGRILFFRDIFPHLIKRIIHRSLSKPGSNDILLYVHKDTHQVGQIFNDSAEKSVFPRTSLWIESSVYPLRKTLFYVFHDFWQIFILAGLDFHMKVRV